MNFGKKLAAITLITLFSIYLFPFMSKAQAAENYSLTIMHVNDSHSHVEKYPMLTTAVKGIRVENPNALLFHAGDVFYGTSYFTKFSGKADLWFMNYLKFDAMTLGNHEFDKGSTVLSDFINGVDFPLVNANLNTTNDSVLQSLSINSISSSPMASKIYPAIIKEVNGEKIGIFGLLTNESKYNSLFQVYNPTDKAKATVAALKQQGINKIILLSHLGYSADYSLAKAVDGIDIIVGAHTHTVLNKPLLISKAEPTVIVQAGQYLDYLGLLNVTFNANGVLLTQSGKLLTVSTYPADPTAQAALDQVNKGTLPAPGSLPGL